MNSETFKKISLCQPKIAWHDYYGDPVRPRRNGFECPPDIIQVAAWITIVVLALFYVLLHVWIFDATYAIIIASVIMGVGFITTVTLKIIVSLMDCAVEGVLDPNVERLTEAQYADCPIPEHAKKCPFCRIIVPENARHCSVCDKCIEGFDHHCRWLNSCIGSRNYNFFFSFMCSAWISIFAAFIIGFAAFIRILVHYEWTNKRIQEVYGGDKNLAIMFLIFIAVGLIYKIFGLCGLGYLLRFHFSLMRTGESTYERIQRERAEKKKKGTYMRKQKQCCDVVKRRTYTSTGLAPGVDENANTMFPADEQPRV